MQIDETDRRILRYYLSDPTVGRGELAERAGVTISTLWRRLEKLRAEKIIQSETIMINWKALGYSVEVSLRFTLDKTVPRAFDEFIEAARAVLEVISIETFLGRVDLRLTMIARDMAHYQELYRERILGLPHIAELEALVLVATLKHESGLPL